MWNPCVIITWNPAKVFVMSVRREVNWLLRYLLTQKLGTVMSLSLKVMMKNICHLTNCHWTRSCSWNWSIRWGWRFLRRYGFEGRSSFVNGGWGRRVDGPLRRWTSWRMSDCSLAGYYSIDVFYLSACFSI